MKNLFLMVKEQNQTLTIKNQLDQISYVRIDNSVYGLICVKIYFFYQLNKRTLKTKTF